MNRRTRSCYQIADVANIRVWSGENDPISPIDRPFDFPAGACCAGSRSLPRSPRWWRQLPPMLPPDAGLQEPMAVHGTWFSPPRAAIAVPATASPLRSSAAAFRRPAVAGFRAQSIVPGLLRSEFRLAHQGRVAAASSPAAAARDPGAASSPVTAAAAPGRPRGTDRVPGLRCAPSGLREIKTARRIIRRAARYSSNPNSARRQHHHDLAAFETRVLLDLGELGDVGLDLVE